MVLYACFENLHFIIYLLMLLRERSLYLLLDFYFPVTINWDAYFFVNNKSFSPFLPDALFRKCCSVKTPVWLTISFKQSYLASYLKSILSLLRTSILFLAHSKKLVSSISISFMYWLLLMIIQFLLLCKWFCVMTAGRL